jgi:CRP-like cAMP-binding protein
MIPRAPRRGGEERMQYLVLGAIVLAAVVIGVDTIRQRAVQARKPRVDLLIRTALAAPSSGLDVEAVLEDAIAEADDAEVAAEAGPGGVWSRLAEAVDPERYRPKTAAGIEISRFILRWGDDYAMVAAPDHTEHFQLELWEADLIERMDGSLTTAELAVERLREDGNLDPGAVFALVETLRGGGILDPAPVPTDRFVRDRLDPASPGRRRLREFGKTLKITWEGAERFTTAAYHGVLRYAFHPIGFALALVLAVGGIAALVAVVVQGRVEFQTRSAPAEAAILLTLGFVLTFVHELGHAAALVHNGRRVLGAGFFIFFGSPAFFVDASDVLMLPKGKRIQQAFAGPFFELVLAGVAAIVLFALPTADFAPLMYRFAVVNYFVILENLVPLLKLDGYWIVCDAIEVPDLRERSLTFLRSDLWHKLRRRERWRFRDGGLLIYGVVGIAYTIFSFALGIVFWQILFGDMVTDLWRGGWASRILLFLLAMMFVGPVLRAGLGLLRAAVKRGQAIARRMRFRLERSWRVEAARMLDGSPAFGDLPGPLLSDLAGRAQLKTYAAGSAVFRRGDRPDAFYIVRSGSVAIIDEEPETGDERVIRAIGRGETFGELALLERAGRAATVRATVETQLFRIDGATFDRLLANRIQAPSFAPTMQAYAELRDVGAFRALPVNDLRELLEHGETVNLAPGEVLMEQGEEGDAFWGIIRGQVSVIRDDVEVAVVGAGSHVGELALLDDAPRSATVVCSTPVRAFRLDREGFDAVVAGAFHRGAAARHQIRDMEH